MDGAGSPVQDLVRNLGFLFGRDIDELAGIVGQPCSVCPIGSLRGRAFGPFEIDRSTSWSAEAFGCGMAFLPL